MPFLRSRLPGRGMADSQEARRRDGAASAELGILARGLERSLRLRSPSLVELQGGGGKWVVSGVEVGDVLGTAKSFS